ncbi:MAG TPA: SRPBCC family protein [Deltaproteobacteria bacterium]|nr:SRPBCC family protein [Deltaproteobacteria bacterium]
MQRTQKITAIGIVATPPIFCLGLIMYGSWLPTSHSATSSAEIGAPAAVVFDLVADPIQASRWRPGVERVETLERVGGRPWYREHGRQPLTIEVREIQRPHRYVTAIVDHPDLGGTWTWTFEPTPSGTQITILEDGEVYNPLFRAVASLTHSQTAAMDAQLSALKTYFTP